MATTTDPNTQPDEIFESAPPAPDDDLWLEYGRKQLTESPAAIRSAASALLTGLGAMQGIYLGVLGFAKFIPEDIALVKKFFFVAPLLLWMIAVYHCLQVLRTDLAQMNLLSPSQIRASHEAWVREKQRLLDHAFWWMFGGMVAAIALVIFRLRI